MIGDRGPIVFHVPVQESFALHIADAGTLSRRQATFEIPSVAIAVCAPRIVLPPKTVGALAEHGLILPTSPHEIQYGLPADILQGFGTLWRYCETVGLDLPSDEAHTAWFSKNAAFQTFAVPSEFGFNFSKSALANAAWFVLAKSKLMEVVPELLDLSFRLESFNGQEASQRIGASFARRWLIGRGIFQATRVHRIWLLPQCLRWIVRELAAATASTDKPSSISLDSEAELILCRYFPDFLKTGKVDILDALMAAWFLHEDFHGLDTDQSEPADFLVRLTVLSRSVVNIGSEFETLSRWASIWAVDNNHPIGNGWNGISPSQLRTLFLAKHQVELDAFLRFAAALLCRNTVKAVKGQSLRLESPEIFELGLEESSTLRCLEILGEIAVSWRGLGREVLSSTVDYEGLGSTSQIESSATWNFPLVVLPNGRLCLTNARAFATRVVRLPTEIMAKQLGTTPDNQFRRIQGAVGRMFEAYGSDVVSRMKSRHSVLLGTDIDQLVPAGCKRGDAVIAGASDIVVLDFSLLSAADQTMDGNRQSIDDTLQRYVTKFIQVAKTPVGEFLKTKLPQLGSSSISFIVVCEDPLMTTTLHQALNPNPDFGVPSHYAIAMADLELLADLCELGVDAASMLGSWQRSTARESFRAVLHRVQCWLPGGAGTVGVSLTRLFGDSA